MTRLKFGFFALVLLAASASLWLGTSATGQSQNETSVLGNLLSRALSTPTTRISIGAVEGVLSSDATIRDVTIADREGVWLRLDRARLVWSRTALLSRRLEINQLEVDTLQLLRRPVGEEEADVPGSDEPLLPELPLKIQVEDFSITEFVLGEPVLGQAARLRASGSAELGNPSEGLNLDFTAQRLDAPGRFAARLAYVPQGQRLDLAVNLEEPEGGLVARLAGIPGLPPVDLNLTGSGTLDDWRANLAFQAGPEIGATGQARLARAGDARRLNLNLSAQIEGLLPAPVAPVFAGTTQLQGGAVFRDSGAIALDDIALTSQTARLTVTGTVSEDQVLDVAVQARALPTEGAVTRARGAEIDRLVFEGRATGPLLSPTITGNLDASGVRLPQGQFGELDADINVEPVAGSAGDRFRVTADARATGIALSDPALRDAVGERAELTLRSVFNTDGIGEIDTLRVVSPNADLSYEGRLGAETIDGTLRAELPRLRAFSGLAGRRLSGSLSATAGLTGNPSRRDIRAEIDARGTGLSVAQPAIDDLLGGRVSLQGAVLALPNGYGFEDLRLEGAFVEGRIDGRATQRTADVTALLTVRDLSKVHNELAGRANVDARLTGSLAQPDVTATVTTTDARALSRPLRDVQAEITARDVTGMLDASVALTGLIGDERLEGSARVRRGQDPVWSVEGLNLSVGSAAISGQAAVTAANLVDGTLRIEAQNLDDLSPLVLSRLRGSINATLDLSAEGGRQDAHIRAQGRSLQGFGVTLSNLDVDLSATDLYQRPVIDGRLAAERLEVGGQTFQNVRLTAQGTPQASELSLQASARGFSLSGRATLIPGDPIRLRIAEFVAERGGQRLALVQPTELAIDDGAVAVSNMIIAAGGGRITVNGRAGESLDLRVGIAALPLSVANVLVSDLGLTGTAEGEVALQGPAARPTGQYQLSVRQFASRETRDAGLPPFNASASGRLADGRATVDATVGAGPEIQLRIDGSVPIDASGDLALTIRGRVDAALANAMVGPGRRVTGRLDIDLAVAGTVGDPRIQGSATLAGGSFTDTLRGIRIANIQGRFAGQGETIAIERLTGATRNGGTVAVAGRVEVNPGAGFPGSLRITANRAELVNSDVVQAVANLDVTVEGPLARAPRVAGRVEFVTMNVAIPDRLAATAQPLPGTRHIAPPPHVRARLAAERREQARERNAPPFEATLDLTLVAPNRIFVRGRGVDAELGGDLRLTGTTADPVAIGAFELRRGRFTILGQRLDFSRGRLTFAGDLTPDLDFVAETQAGEITARVVITGPADQPDFDLTSDPALPQDEVLSRLLFQRASGSLSGFQALQLAQAVAQLSGGGGTDVFEQTRKALGVDSLDITTGAQGGPAVGVSRYIGNRLNVGVRAGARPEDSGITVGIDVTRRLKVQGEVGLNGGTSVGVAAEWEY